MFWYPFGCLQPLETEPLHIVSFLLEKVVALLFFWRKSLRLLLGQESCRTKVSRIFRYFVPNFAPNFAPNFPRIFPGLFALRFVGDGDQKKFTKNPRHFSMQNSQANPKKKIHKILLESRQSNLLLQEASLPKIPSRIKSCNVMMGAALAQKPRIVQLQLQFSSVCRAGLRCCSVIALCRLTLTTLFFF